MAAIANAIYFSDRWQWEFSPDNTQPDTFRAPGGDVLADFMLREGGAQPYYEDDRVQAMPLRFQSGGVLHIIKPKDGDGPGLLRSLNDGYFQEIQRGAANAAGKLLLPRFEMDSGLMELKDVLTALGIPLFDATAAPLTGGVITENVPVYASSAVQKAYIKVDEKGATAAAVTVVGMEAGSAPPPPAERFEMKCDTPFVFALTGSGGEVLFTGVVNRP